MILLEHIYVALKFNFTSWGREAFRCGQAKIKPAGRFVYQLPMAGTCMTTYSVAQKDSLQVINKYNGFAVSAFHICCCTPEKQPRRLALCSGQGVRSNSFLSLQISHISVHIFKIDLVWVSDIFPGQNYCSNQWTLHKTSLFILLALLCFSEQLWSLPPRCLRWERQGWTAVGILKHCAGIVRHCQGRGRQDPPAHNMENLTCLETSAYFFMKKTSEFSSVGPQHWGRKRSFLKRWRHQKRRK